MIFVLLSNTNAILTTGPRKISNLKSEGDGRKCTRIIFKYRVTLVPFRLHTVNSSFVSYFARGIPPSGVVFVYLVQNNGRLTVRNNLYK